jgi:hypothetical protein
MLNVNFLHADKIKYRVFRNSVHSFVGVWQTGQQVQLRPARPIYSKGRTWRGYTYKCGGCGGLGIKQKHKLQKSSGELRARMGVWGACFRRRDTCARQAVHWPPPQCGNVNLCKRHKPSPPWVSPPPNSPKFCTFWNRFSAVAAPTIAKVPREHTEHYHRP